MSYRLINSNEIAIKYPEVNDMPCIYADIPNGLNGDFYDLSVYPKIVENFEQPTVCDIEQIRADIKQNAYDMSEPRMVVDLEDVLQIIERHTKGASE